MKNKKITKKFACIIDTDPGVDDSAALALSLYDEYMDIKLIISTFGNLDIKTVTRNTIHILEKFNRTDIPVVVGADRPLKREAKNAIFAHKLYGMGNYIPPEKTKTKPIKENVIDAMYRVIKENAGNINIVMLSPCTNTAKLILEHPDVVGMISHLYYDGCSAYDNKIEKNWKNYISFNASSDPEALKIVVESGIPLTMVPSRMGRELANFTEEEVLHIKEINSVGEWIYSLYSGYWERGYSDRRIATNDTCAVLCMRFPELFKTKRAFVEVDTEEKPGKTTFNFNKKGNIEYPYKVDRKKLHNYYFNAIKKLNRFNFKNQPITTLPGADVAENLTQAEQKEVAEQLKKLTAKQKNTKKSSNAKKPTTTKNAVKVKPVTKTAPKSNTAKTKVTQKVQPTSKPVATKTTTKTTTKATTKTTNQVNATSKTTTSKISNTTKSKTGATNKTTKSTTTKTTKSAPKAKPTKTTQTTKSAKSSTKSKK